VFGNRDFFSGLAIFLDTYPNVGGEHGVSDGFIAWLALFLFVCFYCVWIFMPSPQDVLKSIIQIFSKLTVLMYFGTEITCEMLGSKGHSSASQWNKYAGNSTLTVEVYSTRCFTLSSKFLVFILLFCVWYCCSLFMCKKNQYFQWIMCLRGCLIWANDRNCLPNFCETGQWLFLPVQFSCSIVHILNFILYS